MKQIIEKYSNGKIECKTYLNHLNQRNGIALGYCNNGDLLWKNNWINDKRFGIETDYYNNKLIEIIYHL